MMRGGLGYPLTAIRDAAQTVIGWTILCGTLMFLGYATGYAIGHRGFPGVQVTLEKFVYGFAIWVAYPQMILAYVVTLAAWLVPIYREIRAVRLVAAVSVYFTWLAVVAWVVTASSHARYLHW